MLQRQYEKLSEFVGQTMRQKGLIDPVAQRDSELSITRDLELRRNGLMSQLSTIRAKRKSVEEALQGFHAANRLISLPKEIIGDYPVMMELEKTLSQLVTHLRRADHDYVPGSRPVLEAKAQYEDMRRQSQLYLGQILGDLKVHEGALSKALSAMDRQIREIHDKALRIAGEALELDRLKLELDLLKDQYALYSKNREEARIREAKDQALDVSLASFPPQAPERPVFPKPALLLPAGILLGLLLAMAVSAIAYILEQRLRTPTDIRLHTAMRCLGELERVAVPPPSNTSSEQRGRHGILL